MINFEQLFISGDLKHANFTKLFQVWFRTIHMMSMLAKIWVACLTVAFWIKD